MMWFKRLLCRVLGHKPPDVMLWNSWKNMDGAQNICIYCPRCFLIFSGQKPPPPEECPHDPRRCS